MNQAYKLVWDEMRRMLVIVAENSSRRGKKTGKGGGRALVAPVFALTLAAGMLAPMGAGDAWAGNVCRVDTSNGASTSTSVTNLGNAPGTGAIACGERSDANINNAATNHSIAIGTGASTGGAKDHSNYQGAIAIGYDSYAQASQGIGIGQGTRAEAEQSVALGANTVAKGGSSIAIGGDDVGRYGIVDGNPLTDESYPQPDRKKAYDAVLKFENKLTGMGITAPEVIANITDCEKDTNGNCTGVAKYTNPETRVTDYKAYWDQTTASGQASVAVGVKAKATGDLSTAFGMGAWATGDASMAVGAGARADGELSTAVGPGSSAIKANSSAFGVGAKASEDNAVALGSLSVADRPADETILKTKAGSASTTGYDVRDDAAFSGVSSNAATWTPTLAAVSVGSGEVPLYCKGPSGCAEQTTDSTLSTGNGAPRKAYKDSAGNWTDKAIDDDANANILQYTSTTRRITNLAAGAADTDAVNVAQLKQLGGSSWKVGGELTEVVNPDPTQPLDPNQYDVKEGNKYYKYVKGPFNVQQGDVVNFVDGEGTTAVTSNTTTITNADGTTTTINQPSVTYNVNKTPVGADSGKAYSGEWCTDDDCQDPRVKWDGDKYIYVSGPDAGKPYPGNKFYATTSTATNPLKVDPGNTFVTANDVATTINNTYWRVKGAGNQATGSMAHNTEVGVHAGDLVTFEAGDGVTLKAVKNKAWSATTPGETTYTFAVNKNTTDPIVVTAPDDPKLGDKPGQITGGEGDKYWDSSQVQTAVNSAHWNLGYSEVGDAITSYPSKITPGSNVGLMGSSSIRVKDVSNADATIYQLETVTPPSPGMAVGYQFQGDNTEVTIQPENIDDVIGIKGGTNIGVTGNASDKTLTVNLDDNIQLTDQGSVTIGGTTNGPSTQITNGNITFKNDQGETDGGTIDGVASHLTDASTAATTPAGNSLNNLSSVKNQAATVEDVQNAGWNLQYQNSTGTATNVDHVIHGDTVNFKSTNEYLTISHEGGSGTSSTIKFTVDAGSLVTSGLEEGNDTTIGTGSTGKPVVNVNQGGLKVDNGTVNYGAATYNPDGTVKRDGDGYIVTETGDPNKNYYVTAQTVAKGLEDAAQKYEGDAYALNIAPTDQSGQSVNLAAPGAGGTLPVVGRTYDQADGVYNGTYYSSHNMQVVTARVQGSGSAPPRDILISQMSNNPTFRNNSGQDTVRISGDQGTVTAAKTVTAGGVTMGNQTPPSSSYVGNGGPNPATGNYVTGLDNKSWTSGNYVSGRAATEDQLQQVAQSLDLSFSGDRNIWVGRDGNHVSIRLNPNVHVDSVTVNDGVYVVDGPSMTKQGINAAGTTITNVAPGIQETDAVNVGQLRRLEHKVNKMGDRADAGIAGAMAAAAVPQVTVPGANLLGAGAGYFHDQSAVAVGYSAMSDNGRWILKANASVSTEEAAASAGVGYQW